MSHFADIRTGEGLGVVLLTTNVFLLLFAYYLLKTVRDALILTEGGAYVKSYLSAAQATLLIGAVPLYGYVATKVVRSKLMTGLLGFFAFNLLIFYFLGIQGVREGAAFYIWAGIFNVFVVSQIWALANDLYTESQGKRIFPMIGVGVSLGAWLGAAAAGALVSWVGLSPYQVQLLAAFLLMICAAIVVAVDRVVTRESIPEMAGAASQPLAAGNGFGIVFRSRYLILIAALVVLLNVVNTTGEFIMDRLVEARAHELHPGDKEGQIRFIGGFKGGFFAGVNLLGFLLQTFAAARLFSTIGVTGSLYLLPSISLLSYSAIGFVPILGLVRVMKTMENATDYSINNTVRHTLFLPTSREAKYKAKAAIDTFFMRFGDVLQAGIVKTGAELRFATTTFAWVNVGLTIVWLWVVSRLAQEHRRMKF